MGHIHKEPGQYDLTSSAFIIRIDTAEPKILLHKHKLLAKYLQIGGHIELVENLWQALAHELEEESGYKLSQLKLLQPKNRLTSLTGVVLHPDPVCINSHPINESHNHTDLEYAFVTDEEPSGQIKSGESTSLSWFTNAELAALTDDETFPNIREIGAFIFDVCLSQWDRVDSSLFALS